MQINKRTTPADLAKLTNAVEYDVVKKTENNTKVTSIEAQIAGLTKNTVDDLADIIKLKFSADANALYDKIYGIGKKQQPSYKWISY